MDRSIWRCPFDKVKVEDIENGMLHAMELHLEEIKTIANDTTRLASKIHCCHGKKWN